MRLRTTTRLNEHSDDHLFFSTSFFSALQVYHLSARKPMSGSTTSLSIESPSRFFRTCLFFLVAPFPSLQPFISLFGSSVSALPSFFFASECPLLSRFLNCLHPPPPNHHHQYQQDLLDSLLLRSFLLPPSPSPTSALLSPINPSPPLAFHHPLPPLLLSLLYRLAEDRVYRTGQAGIHRYQVRMELEDQESLVGVEQAQEDQ